MTNETSQHSTDTPKDYPIGAKFRAAREARNIERKDAAQHLRLKEDIIAKLENDALPADMHVTFLRGYLRAYGKFLELSEKDIQDALKPIQPKPLFTPEEIAITKKHTQAIDSSNPIVRIFTIAFIFLMISLVAIRWYNHAASKETNDVFIDNIATIAPPLANTLPNPPIPLAPLPRLNTANKTTIPLAIQPTAAETVAAQPENGATVKKTVANAVQEDNNVPAYLRKAQQQETAAKKTTDQPQHNVE